MMVIVGHTDVMSMSLACEMTAVKGLSTGLFYKTFEICFTFNPQQSDGRTLSEITSGSTCQPALFCFCLISNTNQVHLGENCSLQLETRQKGQRTERRSHIASISPHVLPCPICTKLILNLNISTVSGMTHFALHKAAAKDDS